MTDMTATAGHAAARSIARRTGALATGAWSGFLGWQRRRKAIADLSKLSDHALWDIGLNRSEIEAAVYGDPTRKAR